MSDPYYEMIAREMVNYPKLTERQVRIKVNDRFAASGYIPVPPDGSPCIGGGTHANGKRCDDTEQYRHEIPMSVLRPDQRAYFATDHDIPYTQAIRMEEESYARAEKARLEEEARWSRRSIRAPKASSRDGVDYSGEYPTVR